MQKSKSIRAQALNDNQKSTIEAMERRLLMSTYTVNTLSDALTPVTGQLTLRQAVQAANTHSGADTIAFDATVFKAGSLHSITLTNGQISLTDTSGSTTMTGPGAGVVAVDGNNTSRVFNIGSGATVSISGVTITHGLIASAPGATALGGGIENLGSLTISNSTVTGNTAQGGSISDYTNLNGGIAEGGGIDSHGSLVLTGTTISNNTATAGNAFDFGTQGGAAFGGGIYSQGPLTISTSSIVGNNTTGGSGVGGGPSAGGAAQGGGIFVFGNLLLTSSTISNNTATGGSGSPGLADEESGGAAYGGGVYTSGSATFGSDTFTNDNATGGTASPGSGGGGYAWGGAIFSSSGLLVNTSSFTSNRALGGGGPSDDNGPSGQAYGGAIATQGTLSLLSSTLSSNSSQAGPGPGDSVSGPPNASAFGGAIYVAQALSVTGSTISGNAVLGAGDGRYGDNGGNGEGGGIFAGSSVTVATSSISGNTATGGEGDRGYGGSSGSGGSGEGGGIFSSGALTLTQSTLSGNQTRGGDGYYGNENFPGAGGSAVGGAVYASSSLTIVNSTITGNTATGGTGGESIQSGYDGGGGGFAFGAGVFSPLAITINDTTITANSSIGGTGGAQRYPYPNTTPGDTGLSEGGGIYSGKNTLLNNTILSANFGASGADVYSTLSTNSANNLIGYGGGLTNGTRGNKIGIHDPLLTPLGWYGGPTQTRLPLSNSPVLNAGNNSLIPKGVTTDQRGQPRITGSAVDIGAVEFGNVTLNGSLFNDLNADGSHQSNEPGLGGFTIYLDLNHDGQFDTGDESATTTTSNGQYTFNGLSAGTYTLAVVGQTNYRATTIISQTITAKAGATVTATMLGQTQDALISGSVTDATSKKPLAGFRVYLDLNNNGKWDSTDPSIVTPSTGLWSFNIASPGTYTVRIVPMTKYKTTTPTSGFFTWSVGKASARIGNIFAEQLIA